MQSGLSDLRALMKYMDPEFHNHLQRGAPHEGADWLFCYRWLLLDFKREFTLDSIVNLWEVSQRGSTALGLRSACVVVVVSLCPR